MVETTEEQHTHPVQVNSAAEVEVVRQTTTEMARKIVSCDFPFEEEFQPSPSHSRGGHSGMHTFVCVSVSLSQYKWTPAEWGRQAQEHRRDSD